MISKFFLLNLLLIHQGTIVSKINATVKLSIFLSPWLYVVSSISNWWMLNYGYVTFVFTAIMIDHVLGTWVHAFVKRDFSMKKNIFGFFTKVTLVVFVGFLAEGVAHIISDGNFIANYFSIVAKLMVFIYPAGSALMNSAIITDGKFPPIGFMNKIKKFNRDLDLSQFKEKKNEDSDSNRPH